MKYNIDTLRMVAGVGVRCCARGKAAVGLRRWKLLDPRYYPF